ncbi:MAG: histidine kinase [Microbacterium sp.]
MRPRSGWRGVVLDAVPAIGLWAAGLLDAAYGLSDAVGRSSPLTTLAPMTVICVLLLFRRRRPLPVLCAIVAVIAVPIWVIPLDLGYWGEFVPWLVALYSCARHDERAGRRAAGAAVSAMALTVIAIRFPEMADPGDLLYDAALLAGSWGLGLFARSWARYRDDALREEAVRVQAEERAKRAERVRIARELHDVVSHTITVVVMQAGGARLAAARDPRVAVDALIRIESLGQESLAELRTLLAVLRDDDDPGDLDPQPGFAEIPELCERMRSIGLPVRLHTDGAALPSVGVQLAVYRIVQESLTNVLKHAGPVETDVRIGVRPEGGVEVEIGNAPPSRPRTAPDGAGRGLIGIRERVAAIGGEAWPVPRPDGGFTVRAVLPAGDRGR